MSQAIPPVTCANPPTPLIHTPYVPNYVQVMQNPPPTINLIQTPPRDNVTFANTHAQYIPAEHTANREYFIPPVYIVGETTFTMPVTDLVP